MFHSQVTSSNLLVSVCRRLKHSSNVDYQYWQRSEIPTMHFQKSLPRLPIPKLELTCERYLAAQRPILSSEAFKKTEMYVSQFKESVGRTLQSALQTKDKNNKHTSYISEPWFNMYLSDRQPLPINYNPVLVFINDSKPEYNTQLLKATNMLISSLRFYKSLNEEILEPEVFHLNPKKSDNAKFRSICSKVPSAVSWYAAYLLKAYPLDMSQYPKLCNSSRIPEIGKDRLVQDRKARHILVQRNGHFYVFNVLDKNGDVLPADEILAKFQYILNDDVEPAEFPLGVLTTLNRDSWANVRQHLISLTNEKDFNKIDTALFNICLDDCNVGDDPVGLVRNFLHGDGTNRWFDKSFSLLISKDGVAAVNFEHSWGDGVAVLRYFQDILKDSTQNPQVHPNTIPNNVNIDVHRLGIKIDDKVKTAIEKATKNYKKTCDSLDVEPLIIDGIGKNACKKYSLSPDAVMQLGFQAAYYKYSLGKFTASYESCSTAAFKHGRTETIRPCTTATKNYCTAVHSAQKPSNAELKHLIAECSKVHGELTKQAAMGQGFDRHLFALRLIADEMEKKGVPIYEDPAYSAINYNIISTSTLSSPALWAGGFGPVVKDGFGIGYSIRDDSLGTVVTSYKGNKDAADFVKCLKASYDEIFSILKKSN